MEEKKSNKVFDETYDELKDETYDELKKRISKMSVSELKAEADRIKDQLLKAGVSADKIEEIEYEAKKEVNRRNLMKWFKSSSFPRLIINCFTLFLIIEKIFGFAPFGHLSWFAVFLPFIMMFISDIIWLSSLSEEELDNLLKKSDNDDEA